jgi:hypothetical protein
VAAGAEERVDIGGRGRLEKSEASSSSIAMRNHPLTMGRFGCSASSALTYSTSLG